MFIFVKIFPFINMTKVNFEDFLKYYFLITDSMNESQLQNFINILYFPEIQIYFRRKDL